jgi:hypothetical protein
VKRATPGKETVKKKDRNMQNAVSTTPSEFAKYIVIRWNGREQAISFPFKAKHAEVFRYIRQECGDVQAVSAGFYCNEPDAFWCGGESDSLSLKSRAQDRELLQAFFGSEDRRQWDLNIMAQEAEATAELAGANR